MALFQSFRKRSNKLNNHTCGAHCADEASLVEEAVLLLSENPFEQEEGSGFLPGGAEVGKFHIKGSCKGSFRCCGLRFTWTSL